ncbi:hypothetical protein [Pantoea ananatis]|nr:hypothetical protein [Pantoea ananatis]
MEVTEDDCLVLRQAVPWPQSDVEQCQSWGIKVLFTTARFIWLS